MLDAEQAADRVEGEPEAEVDRGSEPQRHHDHQGEVGLKREQADSGDLDRAEAQLQRAAVAARADAEEPAAADDPGVYVQADPGRWLDLHRQRVVAARDRAWVDAQPHSRAVDGRLDDAEVRVDRAADVDRVAAGQLDGDLVQGQRAGLGARGQNHSLAGAARQSQPVAGVETDRDVRADRSGRTAEQAADRAAADAGLEPVELDGEREQRRPAVEAQLRCERGGVEPQGQRARRERLPRPGQPVHESTASDFQVGHGGRQSELLRQALRRDTTPADLVAQQLLQRLPARHLRDRLVDRISRIAQMGCPTDEVAARQARSGRIHLVPGRGEQRGHLAGVVDESGHTQRVGERVHILERRRRELGEPGACVAEGKGKQLVAQRHPRNSRRL